MFLFNVRVESERHETENRVVELGPGQQSHGGRYEGGVDVHEQQRGSEEESQRLHIEEDPCWCRGDGRPGRCGRFSGPTDDRFRQACRGCVHSIDHGSHDTSKIHVHVAGAEER